MTPRRYALIVAVGLGLIVGNYVAWGLHEYGVPDPTRIGALAVVLVGFPTYVLLNRVKENG